MKSAPAWLAILLGCTVAAPAIAQSPEPAVDTSARAAPPVRSTSPSVPAASSPQAAPRERASGPAQSPGGARPRVMDRVDLEASQITGNRELPRVLYIVPWRAPAAGELEGRPVNSLLYELTRPVDRDVFRRENRYFDALAAGAPAAVDDDARAARPGGQPLRDNSQPGRSPGN